MEGVFFQAVLAISPTNGGDFGPSDPPHLTSLNLRRVINFQGTIAARGINRTGVGGYNCLANSNTVVPEPIRILSLEPIKESAALAICCFSLAWINAFSSIDRSIV